MQQRDQPAAFAGDGDLQILEQCRRESVPVRLERPSVHNIANWQGAFISSTSRQLLPIDFIRVIPSHADKEPPEQQEQQEQQATEIEEWSFSEITPLVRKLENLVRAVLQARATPII